MRFFKKFVFLLALFGLFGLNNSSAQNKVTISGYVKDSTTGETLIGATIKIIKTGKGTATNQYGFFSLNLEEGEQTLLVSYIGYDSKLISIKSTKNKNLSIALSPVGVKARELVITGARSDKNVRSTEMSRIEISGEKIKSLPVIFGEPDVLKAITLLPGI